jgi:U1 small nuclear ribonucleoprotein
VRLVKDLKGQSRGYAFVTFMREREADFAISKADGRRIDGRRILVDRELGRTKKSWVPRRLGGGKGGDSRKADTDYLVEEV